MADHRLRDLSVQNGTPASGIVESKESEVIIRLSDRLHFGRTLFLGPLPGEPLKQHRVGFEYAEHTFLGDTIDLKNSSGKETRAATWKFVLSNGLPLTYGEICGLAGDFYGTDQPISDGSTLAEQIGRFKLAFDLLAHEKHRAPAEAAKILDILKTEIKAINQAIADHKDPWDVYDSLSDVTFSLEGATSGRSTPGLSYLELARVNWDHFGPDARTAYNAGHRAALDIAIHGGKDNLELAYAMNAFADHFLQDSFAAGHLRTPRRALHKPDEPTADLCAKYMHDEDNAIGLTVHNPHGKHFKAFGDKRLLSADNADNLEQCKHALGASSAEIYKAWHSGSVPHEFGAWKFAPTLESALNSDAQQLKPLFVDGEVVQRRSDIRNRRDSNLTTDYWFWSTAADCQVSGRWKFPQPKMDPN